MRILFLLKAVPRDRRTAANIAGKNQEKHPHRGTTHHEFENKQSGWAVQSPRAKIENLFLNAGGEWGQIVSAPIFRQLNSCAWA
jgi:hypothetical protein